MYGPPASRCSPLSIQSRFALARGPRIALPSRATRAAARSNGRWHLQRAACRHVLERTRHELQEKLQDTVAGDEQGRIALAEPGGALGGKLRHIRGNRLGRGRPARRARPFSGLVPGIPLRAAAHDLNFLGGFRLPKPIIDLPQALVDN